jgi:hypothetical protein
VAGQGVARHDPAGLGAAWQGKVYFFEEIGMRTVRVTIEGIAPISFSAPIQSKKSTGESHDAFEERTWRERLHVDDKGKVFIPPSALKNCLSDVAKYLSESVPGKGKSTYTKHFEAGVMVIEPIGLGIDAKTVEGERLFVPASGKRGDGKRVWKTFPVIRQWSGSAEIHILDPLLMDKPDKVREYLEHAGKFIGMGRFRPRNNGFYGRFKVTKFDA